MTELEREFFKDKEEFDNLKVDLHILRFDIEKTLKELEEDN
jgi:hypothetical protein